MQQYTVKQAVEKLHNVVEAGIGVSGGVNDFLIALRKKCEIDLSDLASLDEHNFAAALKLFATLGTQERFDMWDQLQKLGY